MSVAGRRYEDERLDVASLPALGGGVRGDQTVPRERDRPAAAGAPARRCLDSDLEYRVLVYAIFNPADGCIRIGRTRRMTTRYREIADDTPEPLEVIGCIESWPRLERGIRKALQGYRSRDGWLTAAPEVMAVVALMRAGRVNALEQRYLDF